MTAEYRQPVDLLALASQTACDDVRDCPQSPSLEDWTGWRTPRTDYLTPILKRLLIPFFIGKDARDLDNLLWELPSARQPAR